jgi:hypothetical protein
MWTFTCFFPRKDVQIRTGTYCLYNDCTSQWERNPRLFSTGEKICLLGFSSSLHFVAASWLRVIDTITNMPTGLFYVLCVFWFEILLIPCVVCLRENLCWLFEVRNMRSCGMCSLWSSRCVQTFQKNQRFPSSGWKWYFATTVNKVWALFDGNSILRLCVLKSNTVAREVNSVLAVL